MNCRVQIRILQFFLLSKALLPHNRSMFSLYWLSDGKCLSINIKSFMRISWISLKNWHRRKKCHVVSVSMLQEHNGFKVSSKLCWSLCSRKWLNHNLNLVSNFIPTWSWMLKILFSLAELYERYCRKIDSTVYRDHVCSTPLWHTVKKNFGNTWSYNKKK